MSFKDDVVIQVKGVSKCYHIYNKAHQRLIQSFLGSKKKLYKDFWALRDISFEVKKGETVGIIGLNGSGKSTLLQIICSTVSPTQGEVKVNGRLAALLELGAGFNPQFTGRENVYMNGALMGIDPKEMDQRIQRIEAFAEIGEFIDQPVKMYSSGMFVRLAFASAINVDPDILVIDEALAVGDMVFRHRCMSKIQELKKKKTILFVSHDISAVTSFCDKVIWLNAGKVEEIGSPKSVSEHYQMYAYNLNVRAITGHYELKKEALRSERFGDGRAKMMEIKIVDSDGKGVVDLWPGSPIHLMLRAESIEKIANPVIGFIVRDRLGNVIFSISTISENLSVPNLKTSDSISVDFIFVWPTVAPGSYSFSPFVAEGPSEEQIVCDWIHDAVVLEARSGKGITGLIGLTDVRVDFMLNSKEESLTN